jgi:hypothetical protein
MTQRRYGTRGRIALAGAVAAVVLPVAAVTAGIGFAQDSISSDAYGQYGKKVTICHHTHSTKHPWVTITVSQSALKAHKQHGDDLSGPCPPTAAAAAKAKHHGKPAAAPTKSDNGKGNAGTPGNGKGKHK